MVAASAGRRTKAFWDTVQKDWHDGMTLDALAFKYGVSTKAVQVRSAKWVAVKGDAQDAAYARYLPQCLKLAEHYVKEFPITFNTKNAHMPTGTKMARLLAAIELGMSSLAAQQLIGITQRTVIERWRDRMPQFDDLIMRAARLFQERQMKRIDRAAERDWSASKWLLETNAVTRDEVKPAVEEKKLVIEFNFKRDDLLPGSGSAGTGPVIGDYRPPPDVIDAEAIEAIDVTPEPVAPSDRLVDGD